MPDKQSDILETKDKQEDNSGFTESLEKETNTTNPVSIESAYGNLCEYYVSASGHTRLFSATRYGKHYILKCLKKDFSYTPIYRQALTKEFEIGLQLEHPNICRTIGIEQLPDLGTTIIMEYIDGDTLQNLIEKKALTLELARKITRQLMDALEYMHSKQIIHRDLKPSNIMVTHIGQNVKVIDFGLSDSDSFCILKLPAGTTGYIAPEQFMKGAKAEPRTDIYSLGMVISDMAKATNDKTLMNIAKRCVVRDPQLRPKDIEELRKYPAESPRQRQLVVVLSLLIAALLATIVCFYIFHSPNSVNKEVQQAPALDGTDNPSADNQVMDYRLWNQNSN